jgi:ComF family protein
MKTGIIAWCHQQIHHWLPNACLWCGLPVQQADSQLCDFCQDDLPRVSMDIVDFNALALPAIARGLQQHRFQQLLCLSWYQQPWQHWIGQWKFQQDLACGEALLQQFAVACRLWRATLKVDAVCYVPMHARRLRQRGFNQAEQLAAVAAVQLQLPLLQLFMVNSETPHQVGLNRQQRRANLRKQFRLRPKVAIPAKILLIDDVVTTGATVNTLCRLLGKHGVQHIAVACLAVTKAPGTTAELYLQDLRHSSSPSPPSS